MKFKVTPWSHQMKAILQAKDKKGFAFFFETGTGKTGTCINTFRYQCNKAKRLLRTLIFCPVIVTKNWKEEFGIHSNIEPGDICILDRSQVARCKDFRTHAFKITDDFGYAQTPRIFVTNYESLNMTDLFKLMQEWLPEVIIFDECHYLKSITSKRSKNAYQLAWPSAPTAKERSLIAPVKYLLSGTPFPNNPMDIFMQYKILDNGETFGTNFYGFRGKYCVDRNAAIKKRSIYFPKWEAKTFKKDGESTYDNIGKDIQGSSMHVLKEDCLDLPPMVRQTYKIDLDLETMKHYVQMKRDFITYVKGEAVVAPLALTKALRLMQMSTGFYTTDEGEVKSFKQNRRREALKEILANITTRHKVLVWAVWKQNYDDIREVCKELKIQAVEIHGGISTKEKHAAVKKFNGSKKCKVLFGHPASGGIGINLVEASYSIFYSRNFSYEQSVQAEARNYRGGSEKHEKITRIDLVANNTLDEHILERLSGKQKTSEQILSFVTEHLKK